MKNKKPPGGGFCVKTEAWKGMISPAGMVFESLLKEKNWT